ncbi:MAG: hypothetical protein HY820_18230 [Acidobacteria bacterium]|nr:hypothetical protein [Acidobacteriota bacterium]
MTLNSSQIYTFTPGASVAMAASTNYWLVLTCTDCVAGSRTNDWDTSTGATVAGLAGANVGLVHRFTKIYPHLH